MTKNDLIKEHLEYKKILVSLLYLFELVLVWCVMWLLNFLNVTHFNLSECAANMFFIYILTDSWFIESYLCRNYPKAYRKSQKTLAKWVYKKDQKYEWK